MRTGCSQQKTLGAPVPGTARLDRWWILSDDDLRTFGRLGWLLIPDIVDEELMAAADAEIDDFLRTRVPDMDGGEDKDGDAPGRHGWSYDADALPRCDDVLRRSGALEIAQELVAPYKLDHRFGHIQIATTVLPYSHILGGPHVDNHAPVNQPCSSPVYLARAGRCRSPPC